MDKVIIIQSQKRLYTLDEEWFTKWKPLVKYTMKMSWYKLANLQASKMDN